MIGNTGSSKTTFARTLAQKLGVPHVELDALHWKSEWVMREELWGTTNRETFRNAFLSRDSILLFQLKTHRSHKRRNAVLLADYPQVRLLSARDVERYLA